MFSRKKKTPRGEQTSTPWDIIVLLAVVLVVAVCLTVALAR
jgi:hypothetical protein